MTLEAVIDPEISRLQPGQFINRNSLASPGPCDPLRRRTGGALEREIHCISGEAPNCSLANRATAPAVLILWLAQAVSENH